jgi:hypothetical protein
MPAGRPTDYRAEYCERVIELGKQGYSHAMIASELGCSRQTLHNWASANHEFLDAITHARDEAQAWFERKGMIGLEVQGFNASLWAKQVSCRFPDDYTDKSKTEQTVKITSVSWET